MIRLEYFGPADFPQLIDWISDENLMANWSGSMFRFPLTEEALDWYISNTNASDAPEAYIYKAVDVQTRDVVGHISLGGISQKNSAARISRVLVGHTAARGKGYCTAMVHEVLRIAFDELKLHRVALGVYSTNTAAIRCYQKAGFQVEGTLRDVLKRPDGTYWSIVEMGILESEWRQVSKTS